LADKNPVHSVTLDPELCTGCTNCVKRCPTEAIRVRDGRAHIIKDRCIDCGECIRVCPHHAKSAFVDPFRIIYNFKHVVALPAPTLYGQFKNVDNVNAILTALKRIGFDDVFEVALAAEAVSVKTRELLQARAFRHPGIGSACPAVLRIIRARFPSLIPNVITVRSPMEFAGRWAKRRAVEKTGLPAEDIGCIFITPCPAKATSARSPLGTLSGHNVDGVVSISDVYPLIVAALKDIVPEQLSEAGGIGIGWAKTGGESAGTFRSNYLAADGIENVITVLEALEDERITDVDFVELSACVGGCVGGVLTVENPFVAKARIQRLASRSRHITPSLSDVPFEEIMWETSNLIHQPEIMRLDSDISVAMEKLSKVRELSESFNGMDCGACGAPSCRAFAEDVVNGFATEDLCIYRLREKLQKLPAKIENDGGEEQL
jgi:iron only hydrogenase large subunit-like protein